MPLIHLSSINDHASWALWRIEESLEDLSRGDFCEQEKDELARITNERKKLEWLAARKALRSIAVHHRLFHTGVVKDPNGKPLLLNSDHHISLAHCYPFAVALFHKRQPAGIDIEKIRDKVIRIKHKFLHEVEKGDAGEHAPKLTLYWCAKEAIYKYYGKKKLIFKENIFVEPFELQDKGLITGRVEINGSVSKIPLQYTLVEDYYVCYNV